MAEEAKAEPAAGGGGIAKFIPLILVLLNTLALLGVAGFFYYTRFVFKRPSITEQSERAKLAAHPKPSFKNDPVVIPFDPLTVNILEKPYTGIEKDPGRELASAENKETFHYITLAFELKVEDKAHQDKVLGYKTLFVDRSLQFIGKKTFDELNSVNGRFILKNEIMDFINETLRTQHGLEGLVSDLYFTQFTLQ